MTKIREGREAYLLLAQAAETSGQTAFELSDNRSRMGRGSQCDQMLDY